MLQCALMALQDDYTVQLSNFEGPLDLLLHLIRRAEVDIHDIPIAQITESYLSAIVGLHTDEELDIDFAGEFLVMAATLVELKSRTLAPKPIDEEDEEGLAQEESADPRYELVAQLLAYQRFRSAAGHLQDRRRDFADRWAIRLRAGEDSSENGDLEERELELDDVHAGDLSNAFERIMSAIDLSKMGEHEVEYDDTPIGLHQEDIIDRLSRRENQRCSLLQVLEGRSRSEMIGLFLAVLELARQHRISIIQDDAGTVELEIRTDIDESEL